MTLPVDGAEARDILEVAIKDLIEEEKKLAKAHARNQVIDTLRIAINNVPRVGYDTLVMLETDVREAKEEVENKFINYKSALLRAGKLEVKVEAASPL